MNKSVLYLKQSTDKFNCRKFVVEVATDFNVFPPTVQHFLLIKESFSTFLSFLPPLPVSFSYVYRVANEWYIANFTDPNKAAFENNGDDSHTLPHHDIYPLNCSPVLLLR